MYLGVQSTSKTETFLKNIKQIMKSVSFLHTFFDTANTAKWTNLLLPKITSGTKFNHYKLLRPRSYLIDTPSRIFEADTQTSIHYKYSSVKFVLPGIDPDTEFVENLRHCFTEVIKVKCTIELLSTNITNVN